MLWKFVPCVIFFFPPQKSAWRFHSILFCVRGLCVSGYMCISACVQMPSKSQRGRSDSFLYHSPPSLWRQDLSVKWKLIISERPAGQTPPMIHCLRSPLPQCSAPPGHACLLHECWRFTCVSSCLQSSLLRTELFPYVPILKLRWLEWEMSFIGSGFWELGPQLVALFGEVQPCRRKYVTLSLTPLPFLDHFQVCTWDGSSSFWFWLPDTLPRSPRWTLPRKHNSK